MSRDAFAGRRLTLALAGLIATASMAVVLAISGAHEGHAATRHSHDGGGTAAVANSKELAFHDAMRKLWEDHVTWTRLAIVSFDGGLPDLATTEQRLLRNQVDIGNAIKPFYGSAAGNELTKLLQTHITTAVALLAAAKAADAQALARAKAAWYANANQIADFLHAANPRNWPDASTRALMKAHLDETLQEAVDHLKGNFTADVRDYDAVVHHILLMADTLSSGIVEQFPARFR